MTESITERAPFTELGARQLGGNGVAENGAGVGTRVSARVDEQAIDGLLAPFDRCRSPGAAIGIAVNGLPVYRKGFGLASVELSGVVSPSHRMRLYSISKQFVCLAFLLLCEEGRAGIDHPLAEYLPELGAAAQGATVRQMMSHTSGLLDIRDIQLEFFGMSGVLSCQDIVDMYRPLSQVNFQRGDAWCYNNGVYYLLGAAIERIADRPLEEFLRARIFEPVGMHDTLLRRRDMECLENSATMHYLNASVGRYERGDTVGEFGAAGGIVSTVNDMLRWLAHMDEPVVGSRKTWALMRTPQRLNGGVAVRYGLGLSVDAYRGVETIAHGGGGRAGNAHMVKVPAAGLDVIVLGNRSDLSAHALAWRIVNACVNGLSETPISRSVEHTEGTFRSTETGTVLRLYIEDGRQMVSVNGLQGFHFLSDPEEVLRPAPELLGLGMEYAIGLIGDRAHPSMLRCEHFGQIDELHCVMPSRCGNGNSIIGRYRSDLMDIELVVSNEGEELQLASMARFGRARYRLRSLGEDLWQLIGSPAAVEFGGVLCRTRPGELRWMTMRNWNLRFVRKSTDIS